MTYKKYKHKFITYSILFDNDLLILVECKNCNIEGYIRNYTQKELNNVNNNKNFTINDNRRVTILN